jgi:exopolyphosphatase / guanosine-5'-triphosphate,3'-diphosphate pyrophosphatase
LKYASVDIGTNTLLLLVCRVDSGGNLEILKDEHKIARLGEDLLKNGFISDEAVERAKKILEKYKLIIDKYKIEESKLICCATSAVREAENGSDVREKLEKIISHKIEIISGEEEAQLSFLGSVENNEFSCVLDIGGGSTEIILGRDGKISDKTSIKIGAVKITEKFLKSSPPLESEIKSARNFIKKSLQENINFKINSYKNNSKIITVAGTPTTLAQIHLGLKDYSREKIHNYFISQSEIEMTCDKIFSKPKNKLISEYNVHPNRADVISGGLLILLEFINFVQADGIFISCNGLRFGLIKKLISKNH